jgi:YD repeat-containing protein
LSANGPRQRIGCFMALALQMALLGCASGGPRPEERPMIAPGHILTLPAPGDLGRSIEAAQLITVHRGRETDVFEGHISVTPERLLLVGVDGMGRRAMTLAWDKSGRITAETASWLPRPIPPGPMLADLVVLYWPEAIVRRALAESGATLKVENGGRSVSVDGVEIFHAEYQGMASSPWAGALRYRNKAWNYEIEVQSVELAP